jgi:tRNA pseudouridine synthase 10
LANVKDEKLLLEQLKINYTLCKYCLKRHIPSVRVTSIMDQDNCFICSGLMSNIDLIHKKILSSVANVYEFDSFLIGATIPNEYYEREDLIRSKFKIRGMENVKIQLTRELRRRFLKTTKKRLDLLSPDILINIDIDKNNNVDIIAKTRPLHFLGRYIKKYRGIMQKQTRCGGCQGKGCLACDYSGLSGYNSIEGIIAKKLISITRGQNVKFTWVGSEDKESIVLGKGRPFFARVTNPQNRKFENNLKFREKGIVAILSPTSDNISDSSLVFTTKIKILVECDKEIIKLNLEKLKVRCDSIVRFENKSRQFNKKIYSLKVLKVDSKRFSITILTDGGFQVKQFVGERESAKPNVSEIVNSNCKCICFDILDVDMQQPFF